MDNRKGTRRAKAKKIGKKALDKGGGKRRTRER